MYLGSPKPATAASTRCHGTELNALHTSRVSRTHRCLSWATPLAASVTMHSTCSIVSIVPLPRRKPNWLGAKPDSIRSVIQFSINLSNSLTTPSKREISLNDPGSHTDLGWSLYKNMTLALFHISGKVLALRQQFRTLNSGAGFHFITAESTSLKTPSGPGDLLGGSLVTAHCNSSNENGIGSGSASVHSGMDRHSGGVVAGKRPSVMIRSRPEASALAGVPPIFFNTTLYHKPHGSASTESINLRHKRHAPELLGWLYIASS